MRIKSVCVGYSGIREKLGAINLPKIVKVWIEGITYTEVGGRETHRVK